MTNSRFVYKNCKKLRTGYTTGSTAAAAAKAAVEMLFAGQAVAQVSIETPKGWPLCLDVQDPFLSPEEAGCHVVKDAGDDPDVTDGIAIHARAWRTAAPGIQLSAGAGIGRVTKAGLQVPVGEPAINPVPRSMILAEVAQVLPAGAGVAVEISVPTGETVAKKTYNSQLGIIGGISILGTTGIVEPMSEDALKETIALELSCRVAAGEKRIVMVPGSYGERFVQKWLGIQADQVVKMSNYLGFALEKCAELGVEEVILAGHLGKLVKPAAGIFYTHSRVSDTRMEILTAHLALMGMERGMLQRVMDCNTTEEAIVLIDQAGFQDIYGLLAEKCAQRAAAYVYGSLQVGAVLFSMHDLLAKSSQAERILEAIRCSKSL